MIDSSAAEPYRSLPLPPASKCIRVLDIDPASTSSAPLVGSLRAVDLTTFPDFTALSYVWRSSEPDRTIACNGSDILVSANGHSALRHLRTNLGAFSIWIDGICIDQANTKEKEHQIPLMGDIYSQAATVYVWLGEGDECSDRAINYMKTAGFPDYFHAGGSKSKICHWRLFLAAFSAAIARWSLTRHPFPFKGSPGSWNGPWGPVVVRLWNGNAAYATFRDIEHLLDRKWITRLWTYQEILLAVNPVVVCGNAHIPWDRFAMSLIFFGSARRQLGLWTRRWKRVALSRQQLLAADPSSSKSGTQYSLELYSKFSSRLIELHYPAAAATVFLLSVLLFTPLLLVRLLIDPSGSSAPLKFVSSLPAIFSVLVILEFFRSYAFHSHIWHGEEDRVDVDNLIDGTYTREATDPKDMAFGLWAILQRRTRSVLPNVDYEESKEMIYVAFSRLLVQITGSPHLLLMAGMGNINGQPSWAPDWTSMGKRECLWGDIEILIRRNHGADDLKRVHEQTASISMVGQLAVSVWGRKHGIVAATFVFRKTQSTYQAAEFRKHIHNLSQMLQLLKVPDTAWPWSIDGTTASQLRCWRRFLQEHRNEEASALLSLLRDASHYGNPNFLAAGDPELLRTHIAVCNDLAQDTKILFQGSAPGTLTPASRGWCRRSVKDGDLIIRCPGVQIPLIVRPCSDGRNGVQIKSIAYTSYSLNRTGYLKQSYQWLSGVLRSNESEEPELEEFHVY